MPVVKQHQCDAVRRGVFRVQGADPCFRMLYTIVFDEGTACRSRVACATIELRSRLGQVGIRMTGNLTCGEEFLGRPILDRNDDPQPVVHHPDSFFDFF